MEHSSSPSDSEEISLEEPFRRRTNSDTPRSTGRSSDRQRIGKRASWSEMSRKTDPIRDDMVHRSPSGERRFSDAYSDSDLKIKSVTKTWSYKEIHGRRDDQSSYERRDDQSSYGRIDDQSSHGRSVDQSSYGGRDDMSRRTSSIRTEDTGHKSNQTPAEQHAYCPVAKWDVDYTNKNYVRSKCNKPTGLHRHTLGRQFKWDVDYDNAQYIRSNVSQPKGLHRRPRDIKRKRVPDNDVLADSTGWEFEYGPEFLQAEEDVPYMPDERVVGRGAFRSYGVGRNNSDSDVKAEEKRKKIPGLIDDEFKYGPEFLQDDVQHTLEQKDGVIGRGAYRFYEADRSHCDKKPCDMMGVDYRESRTGIDHQCSEDEEDEKKDSKGKPFKRTVLKKIVKLNQRPSNEKLSSSEKYKYGTHLEFVPGEGDKTVYEGTPTKIEDRGGDFHVKKHPSIRNVFKKTSEKYSRHGRSEEGFHCEEKYSLKHYWDEDISGRSSGDYSVSTGLYPKESPEQSYGSPYHRDRTEMAGKSRKTPERSYEREMPKRDKRPPAQSLTSYESCNLCDRKEVPGKQNRTVALRDESCDICEKKKSGKDRRTSPDGRGSGYSRGESRKGYSEKGRRTSPDARGSEYSRGGSYSKKGYSEKQKKLPGGSHVSFDSCDLCDEPEVPRVATPKRKMDSKYANKPSPPRHSYDKQYRGKDAYEKRRKTSPREHGSSEGDKFQKWKEMEKKETRPLRATGSLTQRQPRTNSMEHKPRYQKQYAFPVELMGDGDFDDEEMLEEIPSRIKKRINEIKREVSEISVQSGKGKGLSKRLTDYSSQRRSSKAPKERDDEERYDRFQDRCIYAGQMMIDDDFHDEEMPDEIPSSIEDRINEIKREMSETCVPREKVKGSSRRQSDSSSQRRSSKVPKEPRRKEKFGRYQDQESYAREEMNEDGDMSSEEFVPHVESTIQIVKRKVSRTSFPAGKKKISPKRVHESDSLNHRSDGRKDHKIKDSLKNHRDKDTYSRGRKENGRTLDKFPSDSGSRIQTLPKKKPPTKLPAVKGKSSKKYSAENVDEFSDSDEIDFEAHKNHPKDHAKSFKDGYEKYVNQNGSEIWIKAEERYSELHHVP